MLNLKNIIVRYDGVQAVKNVSIDVEKGSITGLIGANGAGKSTTLKAISGLIPVTSGEIWFEGKRIDGKEPEKIVELGIGHVPEGKQLFLEMSVDDNLLAGAHLRKDKDRVHQDLEKIYGYFPVLREARQRRASTLSGGEQQMLAIGRGLMSNPKLLLLDEPSLGLSPILTREVGSIIKRIADEGVSILLVEQNASLALQLARKNYVMETGTIALEGESKALQNNDHVKAAYLGVSPTEERPFIPVPEREVSESGIVEGQRSERWQDRGPQGRWQDQGPQGRWQEKGLLDSGPPEVRPFDGQSLERLTQEKEAPAKEVQGKEAIAREAADRGEPERQQDRESSGRWQEEEVSDRWVDTGDRGRATEKESREKWAQYGWQDTDLRPRWVQDRWPKGREAPIRIVKRTFVTTVRKMS